MKSIFIMIFSLLSTSIMAQCPVIDFPSEMIIKEKVISFGTQFTIESNSKNIGKIEETIISLSKEFVLKNTNGHVVAKAKKRLISWGTIVDVYDCANNHLGTVEENIVESMFSVKSKYDVKNEKQRSVASSEMLSFFNTDIQIKDGSKTVLAMHRGAINFFSDTWTVKMSSQSINPLLLIMIPAFKTDSDNERSSKSGDDK